MLLFANSACSESQDTSSGGVVECADFVEMARQAMDSYEPDREVQCVRSSVDLMDDPQSEFAGTTCGGSVLILGAPASLRTHSCAGTRDRMCTVCLSPTLVFFNDSAVATLISVRP